MLIALRIGQKIGPVSGLSYCAIEQVWHKNKLFFFYPNDRDWLMLSKGKNLPRTNYKWRDE